MKTTDTISREYIEGAGIECGQCGTFLWQEKTTPQECLTCGAPSQSFRQEKIRAMSPLEVKEREKLQLENTSEKLRARVIAHNAQSNGKGKLNEVSSD